MKIHYYVVICIAFLGCAVNKKTQAFHAYRGDAVGCGNFIVYQLTDDNTEYVSVAFNAAEVEFNDFQAYGVGKTDVMQVRRLKYKGPIIASLCNDVMFEKPELLIEEAPTQGTIEILISAEERAKAKKNQGYRVTVVFKKVVFEDSSIDYLRIEDVYVGWLPG